MNRRGFVLPLLLAVSLICAFIFAFAIMQQKRRQDVLTEANRQSEFTLTAKRMKQILDTVNLCTCNLRGFVRGADGNIEITPANVANYRADFGFYKLASEGDVTDCDSQPFADTKRDIVLHVGDSPTPSDSTAVQTDLVRIANFQDMHDSRKNKLGQDIKRYKANFTFVSRDRIAADGSRKSRTTQKDPVVLDLYLEVQTDPNSVEFIKGCYWPASAAPQSPSPSPSSSVAHACSSGSSWVLDDSASPGGHCLGTVKSAPLPLPPGCTNSVGDCFSVHPKNSGEYCLHVDVEPQCCNYFDPSGKQHVLGCNFRHFECCVP